MSGSTTVVAVGAHLAVSLSSPSMIFVDTADERPWHEYFRATNQPIVDAMRDRLEAALPRRRAWRVGAWDEALPVTWREDPAFAERCAAGCRFQVDVGGLTVAIALRRAPSPQGVAAITRWVHDVVSSPVEAP